MYTTAQMCYLLDALLMAILQLNILCDYCIVYLSRLTPAASVAETAACGTSVSFCCMSKARSQTALPLVRKLQNLY